MFLEPPVTKENVLDALRTTRNELAAEYDKKYGAEIEQLAEDLAVSYDLLYSVINSEEVKKIPDNHFYSFVLCWTGLNTIVAAIDLFRGGYPREPQMLMRNAIEIFASAYDIRRNEDKYNLLITDHTKFDSTRSIAALKELVPMVGSLYGRLSDMFTHVSPLHMIPHKSETPLCIGGMFDPKEQIEMEMNLTLLRANVDVMNCVIEFILMPYIESPRYWKRVESGDYQLIPGGGKGRAIMNRMEELVEEIKKKS